MFLYEVSRQPVVARHDEQAMKTVGPRLSPFRIAVAGLLAAALLVTDMPLGLPSAAEAQEVRPRRTLLDLLFGRPSRKQPDVIELPTRKKPRNRKKKSSSVTALSTNQPPIAKNPDARHVLVVGDFLAAGLAEGLQEAFAQDPATVVDVETSTASGLVRDDYFDWNSKLPELLKASKPAAAVIMLGANDRQQIRVNGGKEKFDTPAWNDAYLARVSALLERAKENAVPVVWVGLPAFRQTNTSAAALQFNTVYRNEVTRAGGEFVDIWDGFVDENGKFIVTGSDINGQPVRLRTSDGVGMTAAGKRKMAFYAEKPIRKILGNDALTVEKLIRLDAEELTAGQEQKPAGPITRTPPISLTDPELDGGKELLGGQNAPKITANVLFNAAATKPPAGRVDDFARPGL